AGGWSVPILLSGGCRGPPRRPDPGSPTIGLRRWGGESKDLRFGTRRQSVRHTIPLPGANPCDPDPIPWTPDPRPYTPLRYHYVYRLSALPPSLNGPLPVVFVSRVFQRVVFVLS